mmetsp:Transcript_37416/g.75818  ORF Transcript_37416/g.75818 Transcript_37416/m.75818 type:complete len:104 (-) Transcript_37416:84-395(-)
MALTKAKQSGQVVGRVSLCPNLSITYLGTRYSEKTNSKRIDPEIHFKPISIGNVAILNKRYNEFSTKYCSTKCWSTSSERNGSARSALLYELDEQNKNLWERR